MDNGKQLFHSDLRWELKLTWRAPCSGGIGWYVRLQGSKSHISRIFSVGRVLLYVPRAQSASATEPITVNVYLRKIVTSAYPLRLEWWVSLLHKPQSAIALIKYIP
jgi:hypothetical protein